ncbi:hypothetical protein cand_037240 [Cryptosporidium andersoni]|uniref:Uncharacterized protein n=1 Tax=Cryptosporidium andersoni TaxID=117008 RepID=A0A1J4MYC6_9CRYT|nr:hypothetical protein cand_037240 [Cryptosporidium andersoni]
MKAGGSNTDDNIGNRHIHKSQNLAIIYKMADSESYDHEQSLLVPRTRNGHQQYQNHSSSISQLQDRFDGANNNTLQMGIIQSSKIFNEHNTSNNSICNACNSSSGSGTAVSYCTCNSGTDGSLYMYESGSASTDQQCVSLPLIPLHSNNVKHSGSKINDENCNNGQLLFNQSHTMSVGNIMQSSSLLVSGYMNGTPAQSNSRKILARVRELWLSHIMDGLPRKIAAFILQRHGNQIPYDRQFWSYAYKTGRLHPAEEQVQRQLNEGIQCLNRFIQQLLKACTIMRQNMTRQQQNMGKTYNVHRVSSKGYSKDDIFSHIENSHDSHRDNNRLSEINRDGCSETGDEVENNLHEDDEDGPVADIPLDLTDEYLAKWLDGKNAVIIRKLVNGDRDVQAIDLPSCLNSENLDRALRFGGLLVRIPPYNQKSYEYFNLLSPGRGDTRHTQLVIPDGERDIDVKKSRTSLALPDFLIEDIPLPKVCVFQIEAKLELLLLYRGCSSKRPHTKRPRNSFSHLYHPTPIPPHLSHHNTNAMDTQLQAPIAQFLQQSQNDTSTPKSLVSTPSTMSSIPSPNYCSNSAIQPAQIANPRCNVSFYYSSRSEAVRLDTDSPQSGRRRHNIHNSNNAGILLNTLVHPNINQCSEEIIHPLPSTCYGPIVNARNNGGTSTNSEISSGRCSDPYHIQSWGKGDPEMEFLNNFTQQSYSQCQPTEVGNKTNQNLSNTQHPCLSWTGNES